MDTGIRTTTEKIQSFILEMKIGKDTEIKKTALEYIIIELKMIEDEVNKIISE